MSRASIFWLLVLGACAPLPQQPPTPELPALQAVTPAVVVPKVIESKPVALQDYKKGVAAHIIRSNVDTYSAPMPEIMKSIVVLEITIDLLGQPTAVSVYRSNGYRTLERRALSSVAKAAPYPLPAPELLQGRGSLTFLETFLFRDDDFFQVRSLVPPGWKYSGNEVLF
jgi:periplasmic protein TonB